MLIGIHIFVIFHRPFVIRNFRGTCSSIEMLKGYIEKVWEHLLYMLVNSYNSFSSVLLEKMCLHWAYLCSCHTSATTWNSAKSEGTASDECA